MHAYRTHTCGALTSAEVGDEVRVSGWVHRKRDHGDLVFIDLRDHYGMVQIVTEVDGPVFKVIESLRAESVVTVTGKVVARAREAVNPNLPTGEIEIRALDAVLLSAAADLPLPVAGEQEYSSTCGARRCTPTSSSGRRSSPTCAAAWKASALPNIRRPS
jgi:aspartyl-tRNA synthetase